MSIETFYSKKQVAEILGLSTRTIENLMKSGALCYTKIANRVRFSESDIKKLLAEGAQNGKE